MVQINAWGGTTKQFNVDADLAEAGSLQHHDPAAVTALGNANINVGGREITIGQQSVNIRGVGLVDSGGADDVTKGYKVQDIENVVLTQSNGLPIQVKDVASVSVGYVPRLGIGGRDHDDDVATAIVVMGRTQHTNDIIPRVQAEVAKLNSDGSLPPGVKIVPYYDRSSLVGVTTHTVLHNLIFGCLLVFLIQWVFLGDLRSAIIVSANIPFALFFAIIILVLQGEDANLLSLGAVDFGIIVDSAVIMMENIYRNFQSSPKAGRRCFSISREGYWGADPTSAHGRPRRRSEVDRAAAHDLRQRAPGRQGRVLHRRDHRHRLRAAVYDAGRRRPDLRTDGANLWLCACRRAARDLHGDAGSGVAVASQAHRGNRNRHRARAAQELYAGAALGARQSQGFGDRRHASFWA